MTNSELMAELAKYPESAQVDLSYYVDSDEIEEGYREHTAVTSVTYNKMTNRICLE